MASPLSGPPVVAGPLVAWAGPGLLAEDAIGLEARAWIIIVGFVFVTLTVLLIHGGYVLYRRARGGWTIDSASEDGVVFDTLFAGDSVRHDPPPGGPTIDADAAAPDGRSEFGFDPPRPRRKLPAPHHRDTEPAAPKAPVRR